MAAKKVGFGMTRDVSGDRSREVGLGMLKKVGGGKLTRSETVTVRLDPKLRYLAELAARKQRRTLSSFIEWAIERSLDDITLRSDEGGYTTLEVAAEDLWDVYEPDRFLILAQEYPELLTHEEQVRMKIIQEDEVFRDVEGRLMLSVVRSGWEYLKKYAAGKIDYEEFKTSVSSF